MLIITILLIPITIVPEKGFFSRVVLDRNGELLRVFLNKDEQWVYPDTGSSVPEKLKECVVNFEDGRFYYHPGIDPAAVARALYGNISGSKKSGASTITMQLARIKDPKKRNLWNKFIESLQSVKLELFLSKEEILRGYLNGAPYGRNIIGYQTASLRYFGKYAEELSWAEAALLAVLPNSPGGMSPGINHERLIKKRDRLLKKLLDENIITNEVYKTAVMEKVALKPYPFPKSAPHAAEYCVRKSKDDLIKSTIDKELQERVEQIAIRHSEYLKNDGIYNLSVLVCETKSGKVRAYAGSQDYWDNSKSGKVDGVQAVRSSGSILKPFLYAKCIDAGTICENSLIEDIPINISSFSPKNADDTFSGLVRAKKALISSLNVPAVILLKRYGLINFYDDLKQMGIRSLTRRAEDYGLSLIIGGAETSLWDVVSLYRGLGNYGEFGQLTVFENAPDEKKEKRLSKGASYITLKMLEEVRRPGIEYFWNVFENSRPVSWKTGTSYAHKDAWALGVTPEWTIGIWAGNFDGETNKMISGAQTSGPLLFDIFNSISSQDYKPFYAPQNELKSVMVCKDTGFTPSPDCPESEAVLMPKNSLALPVCRYHKKIHLSKDGSEQVCSLCWDKDHIEKVILKYPPLIARTMKKAGADIYMVPEHKRSCPSLESSDDLSIVYPIAGTRIYIPKDIGGAQQKVKLDVADTKKDAVVYWYIDGVYFGMTESDHSLYVNLEKGYHILKVIDSGGKSSEVRFEVI